MKWLLDMLTFLRKALETIVWLIIGTAVAAWGMIFGGDEPPPEEHDEDKRRRK